MEKVKIEIIDLSNKRRAFSLELPSYAVPNVGEWIRFSTTNPVIKYREDGYRVESKEIVLSNADTFLFFRLYIDK